MSIQLSIPGATLISSGTRIGDEVLMTNAPSDMFGGTIDPNNFNGKFLVVSLESETDFTYDGFVNGSALGLTINGSATHAVIDYRIVHNLSKDEQVDAIVAYAAGLRSKRVTLVWPPAANVQNADGTFTEVDGTFLASILASAKSANPAQQGFTNFPVPGPYQLLYSNTYFNKSQIKRLVDGGVFVFVQDSLGSAIYAKRQMTTDPTIFTHAELSCVTAEDKISADLVSMFQPFVGPYNISQDYLSLLNQMGDSYIYRAKTQKAPKCGALMLDGKINSIRAHLNGQNADVPDGAVEVTASAELGKPANWVQIKLLVS